MRGRSLRTVVFEGRVEKRYWLVPGLLVLAVVLVAALAYNLGNLDTGGEALPDFPNAGGVPANGGGFVPMDPVATLVLFLILGSLFAVVLYAIHRMRRGESQELLEPSRVEILAALIGALYFAAILLAWPHLVQLFAWLFDRPTSPDPGGGDGTGTSGVLPMASGISAGVFLAGTFIAAVFLILYLRRGREPEGAVLGTPFEGFGMRRDAAEAIQRTIQELELGGDVRGAIQACFQRFCLLLAGKGIEDQRARTPRELSGLAVERLGVSTEASDGLTSLFEVARYSEHPLDESDRQHALASLERIRSALEA